MDKDLLLRLFKIPSSSGNEAGVSDFIKSYFDNMGITYYEDDFGNLYNLDDKKLPILNAHMDSVQDNVDEKLAEFVRIRGNIMNGYGVIGGDDKCGLFVILEVLKKRDVNFIITRGEEIGCVGINHFMNIFDIKGYPWALTLDRYGSSDILCDKNDYGTKEFENALWKVGRGFGYKPAQGVFSDADYISEDLSCANISVGYYAHHTKSEYVVLSELQNSINFVSSCVENIKEHFDPPLKYGFRGGSSYGYMFDDFDELEYFEEYYKNEKKYADQECFITKKKSGQLVYLPALGEFVSVEGAKKLYEDLEESGILYEDDIEREAYYEDDIDELLKGVI